MEQDLSIRQRELEAAVQAIAAFAVTGGRYFEGRNVTLHTDQLNPFTAVEVMARMDPAAEQRRQAAADRWGGLSRRLCDAARDGARTYLVLRARRIWGRLGNLLRRSIWAQTWRAANQVPQLVHRWVRVWRPNGR